MKTYRLINYFDVWRDEEGFYIVNNQCIEKEGITILDNASEKDIINYLKSIEFLKQDCKVSDFNIDMDFDFIEIRQAETDYPICCFVSENY